MQSLLVENEWDLPQPIVSNVIGSWAYDTMSRRILNEIYPRILKDNLDFLASHPDSRNKLDNLELSLRKSTNLSPIQDCGRDADDWNSLVLLKKLQNNSDWLNSPWLITEFYFYRKVVEAFDYFTSKHDMFYEQKMAGLRNSLTFINSLADVIIAATATNGTHCCMKLAIFSSLWGNKLDLSLWPKGCTNEAISSENIKTHEVPLAGTVMQITNDHLEKYKSYILDDHSDRVFKYLESLLALTNTRDVIADLIVDNAGYELVSDFMLAYILLKTHVCTKVRFHTKAYPTFVSDATTLDCLQTIEYLQALSQTDFPDTIQWAREFNHMVSNNQIEFLDHCYWCQPFAFWEMPLMLYDLLKSSALVIVKGDANYRRLLGDRQWPFDTPVDHIFRYWHVPVCALRVLKAEIACGITLDKQEHTRSVDERWLVSGKWAVVQFFNPNPSDQRLEKLEAQ